MCRLDLSVIIYDQPRVVSLPAEVLHTLPRFNYFALHGTFLSMKLWAELDRNES